MSSKKQVLSIILRRIIAFLAEFRYTKVSFENEIVRLLEQSPAYKSKNWQTTDRIYSACRRNLLRNPYWILGATRTLDVATKYFDHLKKHRTLTHLPFLDLGCGSINPFGVSTIFYLNGWNECWALDINPCNLKRATEALVDLLKQAILRPEQFAFLVDKETIRQRALGFNLLALEDGDLKNGLEGKHINYVLSDIGSFVEKLDTTRFGTICSNTVLEHFMQASDAFATLNTITANGGIHYHYIDFVDHRAYSNPEKYDWWSFLEQPRSEVDILCNKIRCSEMLGHIKKAGFNVLDWEHEEIDYPANLRRRLHDNWRDLSDKDLRTLRVSCMLSSE